MDASNIVKEVLAGTTGGDIDDVLSSARGNGNVAFQRAIAMYISYKETGDYTATGRLFDRERTTVRHAVERIEKEIGNDKAFARRVRKMEKNLAETEHATGNAVRA